MPSDLLSVRLETEPSLLHESRIVLNRCSSFFANDGSVLLHLSRVAQDEPFPVRTRTPLSATAHRFSRSFSCLPARNSRFELLQNVFFSISHSASPCPVEVSSSNPLFPLFSSGLPDWSPFPVNTHLQVPFLQSSFIDSLDITLCELTCEYLPLVHLVHTEFAWQDLKGTGPGPPRPPAQFAKRALFLGREMVQEVFSTLKLDTSSWYSLVHGHGESREDRIPHLPVHARTLLSATQSLLNPLRNCPSVFAESAV